MTNDNVLTEEGSLALIESMINKARNHFSENGHWYLLWGWVVFICSLGEFILVKFFDYDKHYLIWTLVWLVSIYQLISGLLAKKRVHVKTYTGDVIKFVWLTFIVSMFLTAFIVGNVLGSDSFKIMYPLFLILYGTPTFLSGIIMKFKPLQVGAIFCWLLSIVASFSAFEYQLLLISAAMIVAWIIPGYLLRARFKNLNG
jgi:hypothetical protein